MQVIDNFLSNDNQRWFLEFAKSAPYWFGARDKKETIPTGMVSPIKLESEPIEWFSEVTDLKLHEAYINCFSPNERPFFHTDKADYNIKSGGKTVLYYINDNWEYQDGGETQFLIDDEVKGVSPIPNRLVCFDSHLVHRATTFRDKHRFTLALKYGDSDD